MTGVCFWSDVTEYSPQVSWNVLSVTKVKTAVQRRWTTNSPYHKNYLAIGFVLLSCTVFKHWSSNFLRLQNVKIRVTMQAKRSRPMQARFIVSDCPRYLSFYLFNDVGLSGFCHQVIQQKVFWNLCWTFFLFISPLASILR